MFKPRFFFLILGVLAMSFLVGYLVFAWVEPGSTPPGGNVDAPVNVGGTPQTKTATLTINPGDLQAQSFVDVDLGGVWYVNPSGQSVFSGNVGIGTMGPGANLDVAASTTPKIRISNINSAIGAGTNIGALEFWGGGGQSLVTSKISVDSPSSWLIFPSSNITFHTGFPALQERMVINYEGRVGIGKQPSAGIQLDVNGAINADGTISAKGYRNPDSSLTNVTGARTWDTWYTNTDGKTKIVYASVAVGAGLYDTVGYQLSPDGGTTINIVQRWLFGDTANNWAKQITMTVIVPDGWSYKIYRLSNNASFYAVWEQIL